MAAYHVTIGPEFFAKSRNDYADWRWAVVREFFQNSIDCNSDNINLDVHLDDNGDTVVTVANDGDVMTRDIIVNKLFSLGSSGKNFNGTTGGFGKAKEVLYFCHKQYQIVSGGLRVEGVGASYDIYDHDTPLNGTRSTITIQGDHVYEIATKAERFVGYSQVKPQFVINGRLQSDSLRKGSLRRDLGFGVVYTNKSTKYLMIVRINGTPMFTYPIGLDRCVVVELTGNSNEVLTSNRDGLVEPYKTELSDFITELSVDKRSALRNRNMVPRYVHYSGTKLSHLNVADCVLTESDECQSQNCFSDTPQVHLNHLGDFLKVPLKGVDVGQSATNCAAVESVETTDRWGSSAKAFSSGDGAACERFVTIGTDFILKNETNMRVPGHFDPGNPNFGGYAEKLVKVWGRLVLQMHRLFDHESSFSIGFLFDDGDVSSTEAQYESGDFGKVYYLNPAVVVEQKSTYSKSFKKRFKLTERDRLICIAAHEFVHGLGFGWHDERYANQLTDVLAKVMKNRKSFNWCFA